MKVNCIPAFQDNYFWIIENGKETAVVDPGESQSVIDWCELNHKVIDKILITHHHSDHCGGVKDIKKIFKSAVYASEDDLGLIDDVDFWLKDSQLIDIGGEQAKVKKLPGHTRGHIAFWFENRRKVFVGDTLFSMGCGRLFGGTPEQMWDSLKWIKQLPADTQIFCAHEYTLGNLKFVKHLFTLIAKNSFSEKKFKNIELREKTLRELRKKNIPTVPFFLFEELSTNPFLWCDEQEFIDSFSPEKKDPSSTFAQLREMKNAYH